MTDRSGLGGGEEEKREEEIGMRLMEDWRRTEDRNGRGWEGRDRTEEEKSIV